MKKIAFGCIAVVCAWPLAVAAPALAKLSTSPETTETMQDPERQKELLGIWKEHVRTLTQERDDALRQVEALRAGSGAHQQYAIETTPAAGTPIAQRLTNLEMLLAQAQHDRQQALAELDRVKRESQTPRPAVSLGDGSIESETLRARTQTLQAKLQSATLSQQELQDARAFLSKRVNQLENEKAELTASVTQAQERAESISNKNDDLASENRQLRESAGRFNETAVREATQDRDRAYANVRQLEANVSDHERQKEMLEARIQKLTEESNALKAENKKVEWVEEALQKANADKDESDRQRTELHTRIEALEAKNTALAARLEQSEAIGAEADKAVRDRDRMQKSFRDLEAEHKDLAARASELERSNNELRSAQAQYRAQIENLKTSLEANYGDMKNLKSNLDTYLEALVSSFEERQKN